MSDQPKNDERWKAKLVAWTHDPAEKALVLLRDPAGHEGGTVRALQEALFPDGVPSGLIDAARRADRWAASADRPQFPRSAADGRYAAWAQARFDEQPVLIHPLSGDRIEVREGFGDIQPGHIKAVSLDHFRALVLKMADDRVDYERTELAFWRFGPRSPASQLGAVWELLPADTRVPDHTIWAHLDLTSALAGAFAADPDGGPALLVVSFGPVQEFIAQARSTSDLWAGSHLLSQIAWEGLKVVCEAAGPGAVIYPQLRGVAIVDLWLQHQRDLPQEWFKGEAWRTAESDANPLFAAAVPNKFVALVPDSEAKTLAERVRDRVREWVSERARRAVDELLHVAADGALSGELLPCYHQVEEQLAGFPEVHWAVVPWSLATGDGRLDIGALRGALAVFHPEGDPANFLESEAWKALSKKVDLAGATLYDPNPGAVYPALYGLADRAHAAAKSVRAFEQRPQEGYRCSLCGEREWLATDRKELWLTPRRRTGTLWGRLQDRRPSWARRGEHLCALCTLKRMWPVLFAREVQERTGLEVRRYVVSTHTVALSTSIERWLDRPDRRPVPEDLLRRLESVNERAALPAGLARRVSEEEGGARLVAHRLPVLLDELAERADAGGLAEREEVERLLRKEEFLGHRPETYYALLLMDGDRMGAWLSGSAALHQLRHLETWHPAVREEVDVRFPDGPVRDYVNAPRPASPARHMAISAALNAFSLDLARFVVEELYKGKLLYAGGDDVLAMVAVDDVLPAMLLLRLAYSGIFPTDDPERTWRELLDQRRARLDLGKGFARLHGRLHRVMGARATASVGAVIAHDTAPLGGVLRALRDAEKRMAKERAGRNAFCLRVLKRSGGAVELTSPWFCSEEGTEPLAETPVGLLIRLQRAFGAGDLSRRTSFLVQDWFTGLPSENIHRARSGSSGTYEEMLRKNLAYQFQRQGREGADLRVLAASLAGVSCRVGSRIGAPAARVAARFLSVAEFLGRESRKGASVAALAEEVHG
jgi:CRISPR-associated protein Cmr2